MNRLASLSAFFPAYNEEANVERMVDAFRSVLPHVAEDYEIIIVNDGSKDRTREIADRLVKENPILSLSLRKILPVTTACGA